MPAIGSGAPLIFSTCQHLKKIGKKVRGAKFILAKLHDMICTHSRGFFKKNKKSFKNSNTFQLKKEEVVFLNPG